MKTDELLKVDSKTILNTDYKDVLLKKDVEFCGRTYMSKKRIDYFRKIVLKLNFYA